MNPSGKSKAPSVSHGKENLPLRPIDDQVRSSTKLESKSSDSKGAETTGGRSSTSGSSKDQRSKVKSESKEDKSGSSSKSTSNSKSKHSSTSSTITTGARTDTTTRTSQNQGEPSNTYRAPNRSMTEDLVGISGTRSNNGQPSPSGSLSSDDIIKISKRRK